METQLFMTVIETLDMFLLLKEAEQHAEKSLSDLILLLYFALGFYKGPNPQKDSG